MASLQPPDDRATVVAAPSVLSAVQHCDCPDTGELLRRVCTLPLEQHACAAQARAVQDAAAEVAAVGLVPATFETLHFVATSTTEEAALVRGSRGSALCCMWETAALCCLQHLSVHAQQLTCSVLLRWCGGMAEDWQLVADNEALRWDPSPLCSDAPDGVPGHAWGADVPAARAAAKRHLSSISNRYALAAARGLVAALAQRCTGSLVSDSAEDADTIAALHQLAMLIPRRVVACIAHASLSGQADALACAQLLARVAGLSAQRCVHCAAASRTLWLTQSPAALV